MDNQPSLADVMQQIMLLQSQIATVTHRAQQAEERVVILEQQIHATAAADVPAPIVSAVNKPPKPKLPELTKWSGKRADYRAWVIEARAKLETDGPCIGTETNKIEHLYARMEIDGKNLVYTWIEQNKAKPDTTAETFLRYMDTTFTDPNAANRALSRLSSMAQRKDSFATFLPKFERTLAESLVLEDRSKISYLHTALSQELKLALVAKDLPEDYSTYVAAVARVASALEQCSYTAYRPRLVQSHAPAPANPESMDWTPSPLSASSLKPLTDKERDYLRKNRGCFRCRKTNANHMARDCPNSQVSVRTASTGPEGHVVPTEEGNGEL